MILSVINVISYFSISSPLIFIAFACISLCIAFIVLYSILISKNSYPKKYFKNGVLHREDGPAKICSDGTEEWYLNGIRHREGGPAIVWRDGSREWFLNGLRHREDGPARVWNNSEEWWENGKLHREGGPAEIVRFSVYFAEIWYKHGKPHKKDGPAYINSYGEKRWLVNGMLHREDGPAVLLKDGTSNYFLMGKGPLTKEEWWEQLPDEVKLKLLFEGEEL
jgi:hypothetical protein